VNKNKLANESLLNFLLCIWRNLTSRRRRQAGMLLGLMLFSAFAEVVSLGTVLPFLGILVAPEKVLNYPGFESIAEGWGITSADQLVLPLTVIFVVAALMAGAVRILLLWTNTRLAVASGVDLSIEVYRRTLYQPYQVHVSRNSSEVISGVTNKINGVIFGVLLPLLTLVSSTVLLLAVVLTLVAIHPTVAVSAAASFAISYGIIIWVSRQKLRRNSQRIARKQIQVVKALQEGLGGIRDVLLDGAQTFYCDLYRRADHSLRHAQGSNVFIAGCPRPIIEALSMVMIAALAYGLSRQADGIATALPLLGALALGAQRILPALQQIFSAWAAIAGNYASLADITVLLDQPLTADQTKPAPAPLFFQNSIRLDALRFRYSSDGPWAVDGLSLTIPRGSRVGFVGSTGSGKSTALDLLMGLLSPTEGKILVDAKPISGNRMMAFQRSIAHVPQNIHLADTTLAENIAFGVPFDAINMDRVQQAARKAQISDFIESSPKKYEAYVGEHGIRLSGGQRQRIGIARALYKQASILVFDEATSALDNTTEKELMEAIERFSDDLTIILIAHRLTTVRRCNIIVELEHGRVVAKGTYDELLKCSSSFRKLAMAT